MVMILCTVIMKNKFEILTNIVNHFSWKQFDLITLPGVYCNYDTRKQFYIHRFSIVYSNLRTPIMRVSFHCTVYNLFLFYSNNAQTASLGNSVLNIGRRYVLSFTLLKVREKPLQSQITIAIQLQKRLRPL